MNPNGKNQRKLKFDSFILAQCHSFGVVCAIAVVLCFGLLAGSAQTGVYLYSGTETNITLSPGTYQIQAYGATGAAQRHLAAAASELKWKAYLTSRHQQR
jgi:hypothetical protein